ncbi:unnamed protein product [Tilletia controversa]|uniref:BED-type domain-containing protein n=1 Tax=Tilletia caries TaxID=13290 RepID=A0A8T8SFN7_9BASI|nr:hypothetical protein CF336_g7872 [Tilletia laevis]KAE8186471.1 hypothetical protein CF335_g7439 [Tilletia laevis]KAE8239206.1 hypothetical protein A4X03_0g8667 [Tilletia caries]CAD6981010.1 unnamed protein product [Tilletia controversa]
MPTFRYPSPERNTTTTKTTPNSTTSSPTTRKTPSSAMRRDSRPVRRSAPGEAHPAKRIRRRPTVGGEGTAKKASRKISAQEQKEFANARRGRAGSSSLDEEEPSQRSRHKPAAPKDTPYDLEQESQQTSASMRLVKEETEHPNIKNGTRYYRLLKSFSQIRHQQKTGAEYTVITEKWKCCFCDGEYTGHPDDRSSLSLHLNPKHSKSACKGAASIGGGQGSLNSWVVDQRQRNHEVQLSVIRHKALLWVVMDALPFTAPSRPWFRDLMLAASSVAGQGLMSARSVVADLEQLSDRLLLQAVDRIKTYAAPFAIRQDAWSSPSQRHTFVAFVVACLDPSWKHRQFVLNFLVLKGRHGGATFAGHLVTALKTHGILQHWTGIIVVDAASSNGRMSSILEQEMAEVRIFPE